MKKIDINNIRGKWFETSMDGKTASGGDDTIDSIKMVAEKVNEMIDTLERILFTPSNTKE